MAGGWASTLGAAITGASNGYQEGKQNQIKNLLNAIQLKMAQDQLAEVPKKHAESDVDRQFARDGIQSFDDPNFIKNNAIAGQPIATKDVMGARLNQVEGNAPGNLDATPVDNQSAMAAKMGVAPTTGAVIPSSLLLKQRQEHQQIAQNDFITQFIKQQAGNQAGAAPTPGATPALGTPTAVTPPPGVDDPTFPNGVKQYITATKQKYGADTKGALDELGRAWPSIVQAHPNVDPQKVLSNFPTPTEQPTAAGAVAPTAGVEPPFESPEAQRQRMMGKLTGLDPGEGQHESAAHKAFVKNAEAVATASFKPPAAALQRESEAYAKARILIPQLRDSLMSQVIDPSDPTGQQANPLRMAAHMAVNSGKNAAYNMGYPLSDVASKAQQLSGLLTIVGATPYMQGSRSMQMFSKAAQHLTDPSLTPEARIQRLNELEQIFPEFEKAMPEATLAYQHAMQAAKQPGQAPGAAPAQANPVAAPQPAAPQSRSYTLSEVQALANMKHMDPKAIIQQVLAGGGTVTK